MFAYYVCLKFQVPDKHEVEEFLRHDLPCKWFRWFEIRIRADPLQVGAK
jgi:hypothetical protein